MKYLQTAAIFMICLVLSLPFYSASVFAQTEGLTNVRVEGADEYTGFARSEDDTFTFSARAYIPGESVEAKQVRLWGTNNNTGFSFDEPCTAVGEGSYECSFQRIMSDYNFCPHYDFDINLYDESGNFKDDQDAEVVCDTQDPTFISVSRNRSFVNSDGIIKFTYEIEDTACTSGCPGTPCVGIDRVEFSAEGYSYTTPTDLTGPNDCDYSSFLEETGSSFSEGAVTLTVTAYDNFDQSSTTTLSFTVDKTPPSILLHSFEITNLSGNEITYFTPQTVMAVLIVNITDTNLEYYDATSIREDFSNLILTNTPSKLCSPITNGRQCTYSNMQFYLDSADSFQSKIIKINASDKAGNKNPWSLTLSHDSFGQDSKAPVIDGLRITHRTPIEAINWTKNATTYPAYVYVNITEKEIGLDKSSVVADLSGLNPFESTIYKGKQKTSCSSLNVNVTECVWEVVLNLNKSSTFTANLVFNASDNAGNDATTIPPLTYEFKIDSVPLIFNSIGTLNTNSSGHSFLKSTGNTFITEITEEGTGLKKENVFINLSALGGNSKEASGNCTSSGSTWTCYWYNVYTAESDGVYEVSSHADTTDNADNEWDETLIVNVTVDTVDPIVNSTTIVPEFSSGGPPAIEDYIQVGNDLSITINLTEANELSAIGDFSSIITGEGSIQDGNCVKSENYWICEWITGAIEDIGSTTAELNFNFTDAAGNILPHSESITVYDYNETVINYWDSIVGKSSPFAIDKELVVHYDPYVYFPVEINPISIGVEEPEPKELWPVSVELGGECTGDGAQLISSDKLNKPDLFDYNSPLLSSSSQFPYNVYFKFTMDRSEPDTNNLSINCTLKIRTLVNNESITLEETVNLTFSVLYYNNPLGTMDSRISDEIDRVKESWLVKWEWMDTLTTLLNYLKMFCRLYEVFHGIGMLFSGVKDVLSSCCNVPWSSAACCPTARGVGKTQSGFKDGVDLSWAGVGNAACKFSNCQFFYGSEWAEEGKSWLARRLQWAQETYGSKQGYWGNLDPQHSLFVSIIFLCLPGVIYNLQKARVIDCMYINCLKETQYGRPLHSCTYQRAYAYCKFVYGEIFNFFPFAAAISEIGQNILRALSHPYESIALIGKLSCRYVVCTEANPVGCTACSYIEFANWIVDVLCDIGISGASHCTPMWDTLTVDDSVCEEALADE